jgi:hypothetical protein
MLRQFCCDFTKHVFLPKVVVEGKQGASLFQTLLLQEAGRAWKQDSTEEVTFPRSCCASFCGCVVVCAGG